MRRGLFASGLRVLLELVPLQAHKRRPGPSTLSLYNYKLTGVKDGMFSFGKTSAGVNGVALSESQMLSVTVVCAADWRNAQQN